MGKRNKKTRDVRRESEKKNDGESNETVTIIHGFVAGGLSAFSKTAAYIDR